MSDTDNTDIVTAPGGEVKALGQGRIGGYLVRYSTPDDPDLTGEFFSPDTDFGPIEKSVVLYHHGFDDELGRRSLGEGHLRKDKVGVWIEAQLALRDEYERAVYELAKRGKLGWSSGTAGYLVEKRSVGQAREITRWPLGLDASLTPTPAEPRNNVIPIKSLIAMLHQAGQPEPDGSMQRSDPVTTPPVSVKESKMEEITPAQDATPQPAPSAPAPAPVATPQPQPDNALKAQIDALKAQVDALTRAPIVPTPGISGPMIKTRRETMAEEQLEALKSFMSRRDRAEWDAHQRKVAEYEADALKAWRQLVATPNASTLERYRNEAVKVTLIEGAGSLGGFLVPTLYSNQLVGTLTELSILRVAGAQQIPVAGTNSFRVATITRSGSAPLVSELGVLSQTEPTFGEVEFRPYKYAAQYISSRETIADSRFPLEDILITNAAWQFVQSENIHFAVGTGTGQPQGINNATTAVSAGSTLSLLTGDHLIDLYHSVPYQYRDNCAFFMHDQVARHIRRLRDAGGGAASTGNYLWQPGLQAGQPDRLLGRPVYTLNAMPSSGSTANIIVFGDPRFFWIADFALGAAEFNVLNELYAASGAVGWWFWRRMDSRIMISEAFRGLRLV